MRRTYEPPRFVSVTTPNAACRSNGGHETFEAWLSLPFVEAREFLRMALWGQLPTYWLSHE